MPVILAVALGGALGAVQAREYTRATLYMGGSVILSVAGVLAGMMMAALLSDTR